MNHEVGRTTPATLSAVALRVSASQTRGRYRQCGEKQRPSWALKRTFLGGVFMFIFGVGKIENLESKIVTLIEPVKAIGLSVKTSVKTVFGIFLVLVKNIRNIKIKMEFQIVKNPGVYSCK